MEMMEVLHPSQQDMDLIDILWKQDIDLGARREVFDYNHRQKEHELQRQRELEEQKRIHLRQEQEKALLAQLQLDEETGEYIPRPVPSNPLQSAGTPLEVTQTLPFIEENNAAISFDECLQLLAETFPIEETENPPVSLCTGDISPNSIVMMSPEQQSLLPTTPSPVQLPPQKTSTDLEQAWMELLSLPELQECMHMQIEDTLETTIYPNSSEVQNPNFTYYPVSEGADNACPGGYSDTFNAVAHNAISSDNLNQMDAPANYTANPEDLCGVFYPENVVTESSGRDEYESNLSTVSNNPTFTSMDLYSLSPGEAFDRDKPGLSMEMQDSDSGISNASPNASPNASLPDKSVYGDGYSDSDMDELDQNPGSAHSDYSEMFSLNFTPDDGLHGAHIFLSSGQSSNPDGKNPKKPRNKPAEESGQNRGPFTKDKLKKRSDVRLTRDEQRAKALKIPFTVEMIINLPVDDFNELMSKHQLNEAQLALVRDIRRRGKNKVAAQNCRKRKMENIVGLESDLDSLKEEKERLLSEKSENLTNLKEMKKQLNTLYLEVFSLLKDEEGNSYSPSDYSLQQSTDGSIFLVPRIKKTFKYEDSKRSLK